VLVHNPATYKIPLGNIMTLQLTFNSAKKLEFAFGKLTSGKELQLYGEYFPAIGPLMAEYSSQQVGTFAVVSSNYSKPIPEMGALTQWPSMKEHQGFFSDARFVQVKPLRDDSLDLLSDGHFFKALDQVIEVKADLDYAIVITKGGLAEVNTMVRLPLDAESPEQRYAGKCLTLAVWDEQTEKLLQQPEDEVGVFRVRFNKPTA